MFAILITGPPGAGKTATLIALSDALADDEVAHAAVDVDDLAWTYPHPDLDERAERLARWLPLIEKDLVLVAEVIESPEHLERVLAAIAADDRLVVRLDAAEETLRARIVAREPPGWSELGDLLESTAGRLRAVTTDADLTIDTEACSPDEAAARIRAALSA